MFMRSNLYLLAVLLGVGFFYPAALQAEDLAPKFGVPISEKQAHSIVIWPDGRGLPRGRGTVAQGKEVYQTHCIACHGVAGQGGINDTLAGGWVAADQLPAIRTIGSYWPYATSVFDYVRRTMPYNAPGSLDNDQVYAVVAYLLFLNQVVDEKKSLDAGSLQAIELPNKSRFFSKYRLP